MHRCDAILLDMDGTLVDSTPLVERLWREFADRWDLGADEVIEHAHGRPTESTVSHFLPAEAVEAELRIFERDELDGDGVVAIVGAPALVSALAGLPTALVTSATRSLARHRMELGGMAVPDVLVGSDDVTHGKPDPEPFLRAAELLGVRPERCLVLEDSRAGLDAAAAAGMAALQVGLREPEVPGILVRVPDLTGVRVTPSGTGLTVEWD